MIERDSQDKLIFSLFESARQFAYIYSTSEDDELIRYAKERFLHDYKLAKAHGSVSEIADGVVRAAKKTADQDIANNKTDLEYQKILKTIRREETIDDILHLGIYPHHKVDRLLDIGFLAIHLGIPLPHVILYAGMMAQAYRKEIDYPTIALWALQEKAQKHAMAMRQAFDRGERSDEKKFLQTQLGLLESYLRKRFRQDNQ